MSYAEVPLGWRGRGREGGIGLLWPVCLSPGEAAPCWPTHRLREQAVWLCGPHPRGDCAPIP